jgi:hypothetical protein
MNGAMKHPLLHLVNVRLALDRTFFSIFFLCGKRGLANVIS